MDELRTWMVQEGGRVQADIVCIKDKETKGFLILKGVYQNGKNIESIRVEYVGVFFFPTLK